MKEETLALHSLSVKSPFFWGVVAVNNCHLNSASHLISPVCTFPKRGDCCQINRFADWINHILGFTCSGDTSVEGPLPKVKEIIDLKGPASVRTLVRKSVCQSPANKRRPPAPYLLPPDNAKV